MSETPNPLRKLTLEYLHAAAMSFGVEARERWIEAIGGRLAADAAARR